MNPRDAFRELIVIKVNFKREVERCRVKAKRTVKKLTACVVRGNAEHAEAYHEEMAELKRQVVELQRKIDAVREIQDSLRQTG